MARLFEERGLPTTSLSNILDVTQAVKPPRAAFTDLPYGRPCGRPFQPAEQRAILRAALGLLATAERSGEVVILPYDYGDGDAWKDDYTLRPPEEMYV